MFGLIEKAIPMEKRRIQAKDLWLFAAQVGVWAAILLLFPLVMLLGTRNWESTSTSMLMVWQLLRAPLAVYFANFYLLAPFLFFRRKYWLFALCNLVLILGLNYGFFFGYFAMKEQMPEMTGEEAELAWLKNQINPHFLFNTLNNISSLTQIDPDAAQDMIARLSDLLRYAMYETNKPMVPIEGEVEFMRNYISLMKLRCNDRAVVTEHFKVDNPHTPVAPLLFISLIENAFKHGLSSSRPSAIHISLRQQGGEVEFCCDNTNYPKSTADRSGSGIGLENTRRRLELLYHRRYEWQQEVRDNIYHVKIIIRL